MEYKDVIRDFALRTKRNLEFIEKEVSIGNTNADVYETTQLINSLLGLIVFPREEYMSRIRRIPLQELVNDGWAVPRVIGQYPQAKDLRDLIYKLRHAVSHFNLEFISNIESQISGIKVWNCDMNKKHEIIWVAELEIEELRDIAYRFIDLIIKEKDSSRN